MKRCLIAIWSLQEYLADAAEDANIGNDDAPAGAEDDPKQRDEMLVELRRADEATRDPKCWLNCCASTYVAERLGRHRGVRRWLLLPQFVT